VFQPRGAYYIMTDISSFHFEGGASNTGKDTNDVAFAKFLVEKVGVAVVPGSSFYGNPSDGASQVRFTFCKKESTLSAAEERLASLPEHLERFRVRV
jgi:aspartate/methionine/tyrosine aminotransferase